MRKNGILVNGCLPFIHKSIWGMAAENNELMEERNRKFLVMNLESMTISNPAVLFKSSRESKR